ncbi:pilin [Frateuria aurantia]|uniref:Prepilin-type N-terminal cleavage/methylation domain-containing protein n=1 Tax=Frateuria aurantia (strain ATCC 33424 / DSM 6220 / KCTC 2777 / LMG 1558 / NBRC 3245 / NCIMB 13370) TaxID=767434 RepID=H8L550_FRAAD|nr:pilin [Frateuria aurantia]AFC86629.1 prepilin-type N-terminal cleavage/methylation domain-containing protein [Frateuria aurantia DSM 6220]
MQNSQKGFTLIELMIVVAIIAILAAIAIPQYQNYITKAQFSESQSIIDGLKTPIAEFATQNGACPLTAGPSTGFSAAASYSGKYIAQTALTQGTGGTGTLPSCIATMTFKSTGSVSAPLAGKTVQFTSADNGGTMSWSCTASGIASKYKPATCPN